jgi:hypothetical protein
LASTLFSAALAASRTTAAAAYTVSGSGFLHGVYGGFCGFLDGFDGFAGGCGGFEEGFEGGLCGFLGVVHLASHFFLSFLAPGRGVVLYFKSLRPDTSGSRIITSGLRKAETTTMCTEMRTRAQPYYVLEPA